MTDKIYILKDASTTLGNYHGKFFTSPYTAMAKGARMMLENPSVFEKSLFTTEMYGIDIDDVPCDHIAIHTIAMDIVNFIHRNTHVHGFVLLEKNACIYEVLLRGESIGKVFIIFLPPLPESLEIGEIMFRVLHGDKDKLTDLAFMVQQFWDSGC